MTAGIIGFLLVAAAGLLLWNLRRVPSLDPGRFRLVPSELTPWKYVVEEKRADGRWFSIAVPEGGGFSHPLEVDDEHQARRGIAKHLASVARYEQRKKSEVIAL